MGNGGFVRAASLRKGFSGPQRILVEQALHTPWMIGNARNHANEGADSAARSELSTGALVRGTLMRQRRQTGESFARQTPWGHEWRLPPESVGERASGAHSIH